MADHLMLVFSNAKPEIEDHFNDWYTNVHIRELVDRLDPIDAAQRFVLSGSHRDVATPYKYLAIYWIPEDKLAEAQAAMAWQGAERLEALAAGREPVINREDVFEGMPQAWFFSKVSDKYVGEGASAEDGPQWSD
ncbi:MAG: hypothetical protein WCI29_13050 [Actinomycetes bacterium]